VDDEFSRPEFRLTLDTKEDYKLIRTIYERFYEKGKPVDLRDVFKYLDDNPKLANINRFVQDKELNVYVKKLNDKAVFSVYQAKNGKYVVKDRMGGIIPYPDFKKFLR
jgi:replicative DNA helicase